MNHSSLNESITWPIRNHSPSKGPAGLQFWDHESWHHGYGRKRYRDEPGSKSKHPTFHQRFVGSWLMASPHAVRCHCDDGVWWYSGYAVEVRAINEGTTQGERRFNDLTAHHWWNGVTSQLVLKRWALQQGLPGSCQCPWKLGNKLDWSDLQATEDMFFRMNHWPLWTTKKEWHVWWIQQAIFSFSNVSSDHHCDDFSRTSSPDLASVGATKFEVEIFIISPML